MRVGRRSRTSDWVAALRALYTGAPGGLDVAPDPIAGELLPAHLRAVLRLAQISPATRRLSHATLGALTLGLSYGIPLRTAAIDAAIRSAVRAGVRQLVVLGAGLDARAFRMPELAEVMVLELDHPGTQAYKRQRVALHEPLARHHRLCAVDFERDSIAAVVAAAGLRPDEPSFWLWEGVTMYLSPAAIDASLAEIAAASAPGSQLAVTYTTPDSAARWLHDVARLVAAGIGEPLRGYMQTHDFHERLAARGYVVASDTTGSDWARRFWPPDERAGPRGYERLVVAERRLPTATAAEHAP